MANYLSLEDAAKKLGIPTDKLVELRSQGKVRGFRDGSSWKFPEDSIDQLQDDLPDLLRGGSDLGLSGDLLGGGSDVNLVASGDSDGSDVAIVASDSDLGDLGGGSDLLEIDSADLQLDDPAIMHDSAQLDLAIEPNAGSTGPVTDAELNKIADAHPDVVKPESTRSSDLDGDGSADDSPSKSDSGLSVSVDEEDSGDMLLGEDDDLSLDMLSDSLGSDASSSSGLGSDGLGSDGLGDDSLDLAGEVARGGGASSLELMNDLNPSGDGSDIGSMGSRGVDVLSELDLLGAEQTGSGLISGDSENLLGSSGLGSSMGADSIKGSDLSGLDDALDDDDDLVISDDDDDLVISSGGSDVSIAGDSGINLMSPSDSGLSLESEPLDLAGSSISALDLGAELSEGGSSGSGGGGEGSGSLVDFQADEEFQLSPSGVGLDADIESGSQVIEVEDSADIGEAVEFDDDNFADADPLGGDVFGAEEEAEPVGFDDSEETGVAIDPTAAAPMASMGTGGYEVPFTLLQCVTLMLVLCVLGLGGMLMTDLVRNMWTYSEPSAPVSSLTDSLIGLMGWGQ